MSNGLAYSDAELWFSPKGRINRQRYWIAGIAAAAVTQVGGLILGLLIFRLAYIPISLLAVYSNIVLGIKRCHDRGRSGWFMLLFAVPLLNLWPFVELLFLKGETGSNKYGPDPLGESAPAANPA